MWEAGVEFIRIQSPGLPRLVLGGIVFKPVPARGWATIQKKKVAYASATVVYAYNKEDQDFVADSCPIANSFQSAHRSGTMTTALRYQILAPVRF